MNFISERIENEEDIKYFNSFGFKDITGKEFKPFWWVIDRDADMFLFFCEGRTFGLSQKCGLCIDKELVELEVLNKSERDQFKSSLTIHWIVNKVDIPISLIEKGCVEDDIMYIIENALIACGLPGVASEESVKTSVDIIVDKGNRNAARKISTEDMAQSSKDKKNKKDDPFGCFLVIAIVLAYIIAEIISSQNDIEYSDGMLLRKLTVAIAVSIYGIIYYIRKKIKK